MTMKAPLITTRWKPTRLTIFVSLHNDWLKMNATLLSAVDKLQSKFNVKFILPECFYVEEKGKSVTTLFDGPFLSKMDLLEFICRRYLVSKCFPIIYNYISLSSTIQIQLTCRSLRCSAEHPKLEPWIWIIFLTISFEQQIHQLSLRSGSCGQRL